MMCPLGGTRGKARQPFHWGRCGFTVPSGMPHLGLLKTENTKLITDINHLLLVTPISKQAAAQPIHRPGATLCPPLRSGRVGSQGNNIEAWDGSKDTTWSMTIARTTRETIPLHLSAGVSISDCLEHWYVRSCIGKWKSLEKKEQKTI